MKLGDILWLNSLPEDAILQPGELIRVRLAPDEAPPPTPTPILYHTVRKEQTLWEIAISYGLSLDELLALNGIEQDAILQPGDQLLIRTAPTATVPPTATAVSLPPTPLPSQTPTAVSTAVANIAPQPSREPSTPTNRSSPNIAKIAAWLLAGLLIVGLVVAFVLRSEMI